MAFTTVRTNVETLRKHTVLLSLYGTFILRLCIARNVSLVVEPLNSASSNVEKYLSYVRIRHHYIMIDLASVRSLLDHAVCQYNYMTSKHHHTLCYIVWWRLLVSVAVMGIMWTKLENSIQSDHRLIPCCKKRYT